MKDLTFQTLIAVFEEIFGRGLFWGLAAAAFIVTLMYLFVLVRDRKVGWRKFLIAQLFMPIGAVFAVVFVMWITHSQMGDIGGPVDVIIFLIIAALGAIGTAILVYTVEALFFRRRIGD